VQLSFPRSRRRQLVTPATPAHRDACAAAVARGRIALTHGPVVAAGTHLAKQRREESVMDNVRHELVQYKGNNGALAGGTWFAGWLFTIGFAKLIWWKVILAIVAWPYFLAQAIR
jgi:hypothetical protein